MFSSPLLREARTWLPEPWRRQAGRILGGPPPGSVARHFRAVIFQLDRLGDLVLALSVIRTMLREWGEENCLLVVSQVAAPLAAREFPRTPRLALPVTAPSLTRDLVPAWWQHRRKLRGIAGDEVVCLSHHRDLYKETALSWIRGVRRHWLDRASYPLQRTSSWSLEIVAHRQLVGRALGRELVPEEVTPSFNRLQAVEGRALVVCPFASESIRRLPETLLLDSLELWSRRSRAPIVFSGTAAVGADLSRLASRLQSRRPGIAVEVAAADGFEDFLARLAGAGAVLATESGPAHAATALDKRAVLVVGGGMHGLCMPWRRSTRQTIAEHVTPCYHCGGECTVPGVPCLSQISPAFIAEALPAL